MLNNSFGKFIVGNSEVHALSPIFKVLSLIIMLIAGVFINSYVDTIMIFSYLILCLVYSSINLKKYIKDISHFSIFILFILFIDIIFLNPIEVIVSDIFRIIFIILYVLMFMYTTTINELIYALERILTSFKGIVNINNIILYLSLIFKFPTVFICEKNKIIRVYKERKIVKEKKILDRLVRCKNNINLAFNSSIRRLNNMSTDMKIRLYGYGKSRTNYRGNRFGIKEGLLLILNIIILIIVMFY